MPAKPWADTPIPLLNAPEEAQDPDAHSAIKVAAAMTLPHNLLLRGLNAMILQGPHVHEAQDTKDFLFFCRGWARMVEEHHGVEDSFLFPELERLTGKPNIAESEKAAHEGLHEGLERLKEYTERTMGDGSGYAWEGEGGLREVIDGFTGEFRKHLGDEVDMLMSLKSCDSEELWRVWNAMEDHIKAMKMEHVFDVIMPMSMGCSDYPNDSKLDKHFPPWPSFFPYLVKYWFGRKHSGAWRFCPSDFWGQPRPLPFVGDS